MLYHFSVSYIIKTKGNQGEKRYADPTFTIFCSALSGKKYIEMQSEASHQPAGTQPADESNGT